MMGTVPSECAQTRLSGRPMGVDRALIGDWSGIRLDTRALALGRGP